MGTPCPACGALRDPVTFRCVECGETVEVERTRGRRKKTCSPERGKRAPAKNWSVPTDITLMAAFLRERLTSYDRLRLSRLLAE